MKLLLSFIIMAVAMLYSQAESRALRIDIKAVVSDSSAANRPAVEVFHGQLLIPFEEPVEVFTGPYTIQLNASRVSAETCALATSFFGLGPKFHNLDYNIKLAVGDDIFVPPLPVKNDATVKYFLKILDDTSGSEPIEPPLSDTTAWGISESVHYRTHWLKGSLADYMWNVKMSYLERLYDGFRKTFTVSSFYKIDFVFHPEPVSNVYIKPGLNYAIQPRKMWIDVVYGHEIDGATPRPAAELLLYKLWGYGPRWLVTGFSGYYFDNFLQMRKFAGGLSPETLDSLLADEVWVDSDTGQVVTGALVRWLAESDLFLKFMELYQNSGPVDFREKYAEIYGRDFMAALEEFLSWAGSYKPKPGELAYFGSTYMNLGMYKAAREYMEEIVNGKGEDAEKFRPTLARCLFWLGDYEAASRILGPMPSEPECASLWNMLSVAMGTADPFAAYSRCANVERYGESVVALASAFLDNGDTLAADTTLSKLDGNARNSPEYFIESGRLRILEGQRADSLLNIAASIVIGHSQTMPHDPAGYSVAGQAFSLIGNFDMARENLQTAFFLEKRPYFLGQVLLELGKLADLEGERNRARDYYNEVLSISSGEYQKALAKRYLEKKYDI